MNQINRVIRTSVVLILVGAIALAVGVFFNVSGRKQVARDTEAATATVTDYVEGSEYDSNTGTYDTVYYPVMSYEVDGQTIESQYSQYDFDQNYEIGESVAIKYNPDDPEEFIIEQETNRFLFSTIWEIPLGIVLIIAGLVKTFRPVAKARK